MEMMAPLRNAPWPPTRWRALGCAVALGAALLTAPGAVQAQTPADGDFLLYVRDFQRYPGAGTVFDEYYLFRDGEGVFHRTEEHGAETILRIPASAAQLAALNQILIEQRVGQQSGYCGLEGVLLPLPVGEEAPTQRDTLITWFGRGERLRHLPVGLVPGTPEPAIEPCTPEVAAITEGLYAYLQAAVTAAVERGERDRGLQLLFHVHNAMQEDVDCGEGGFEDSLFLFRDGFFLRRFEDLDRTFQVVRSQGLVEALEVLRRELAEHQVGVNGGFCRLSFFTPFFVDGGCLDFTWQSLGTWFGRRGRQAEYFGSDESNQACTFPQQQVQRAVNDYVRNTLGQSSRHEVGGRLPQPLR
jgi:hypothetical protein